MEEQIRRFPCVAEKIFGCLEARSLVKCREVCKSWKIFIQNSKFSWVRMIKGIIVELEQPTHIHDQWNRVLLISNIEQVKFIAWHLNGFLAYRRALSREMVEDEFSPLFILAHIQGSINLYKDLCKTFDSGIFLKKKPIQYSFYFLWPVEEKK